LEIDTVVGKNHKGFLLTVVDRKSKFSIIKSVPTKHAQVVTQAQMLTPMKKITHTIISDNGKEFAYHKQVSVALDTNFYFIIHNRLNHRPRKILNYKTPYEVFF
jgi:IS30 family transposase